MKRFRELIKYIEVRYPFVALLVILVFLGTSTTNRNHAMLINHCNDVVYNFPDEKDLTYTFKVADKLIGNGEMKLSIQNNRISGIARGMGKVTCYDIDFHTNIYGALDCLNGCVNVTVIGEGDPLKVPLPGKVSFEGPLKGYVQAGTVDKKPVLRLIGKVHIKGKLAWLAGFKNTEDLVIEIPVLTTNLASL